MARLFKTSVTVEGNITSTGTVTAVAKSFLIDHPTKSGKKLRHGSLEGPENGVYVRGTVTNGIIELPEYWTKLVDPESITVSLTPIGKFQKLYVKKVESNKIFISGPRKMQAHFTVFAERIDVSKLVVEE
jgi:hypothetical protein